MDSKNIYISGKQYAQSMAWEQQTNQTEWMYIGIGDDYNEHKIIEMIDQLFGDAELYYINTRQDSREVHSEGAADLIKSVLEHHGATLSNKDFTRMLDFHRIGVARIGNR